MGDHGAPPKASPAKLPSTSAMATGSRQTSTGRRASGRNGVSTRRSSRPLQRAGSTRSRSNAPEPRFRSTYSAFCRTRKSCSGRSMSPATASRHRRKSRKRSSGRRALFHWNDCIPARTAAWHRWTGRWRSANSSHSALGPRSSVAGSSPERTTKARADRFQR